MKETKNAFIKVRVTEAERAQIQEYAKAHNMTVSDLIRTAVYRVIGGNENGK